MPEFSSVQWRKSSFSTASGTCVEVGLTGDDVIVVRNSNEPEAGTVRFSRADRRARQERRRSSAGRSAQIVSIALWRVLLIYMRPIRWTSCLSAAT